MIHCNLSVLLAERQLKISKVAADTGISRTTLTALAKNNCQGIQINTLNTLCIYLDVTPSGLFVFSPIEIIPERATGHDLGLEVYFRVQSKRSTEFCSLGGAIRVNNGVSIYLTKIGQNRSVCIDMIDVMRNMPLVLVRDIESQVITLVGKSVEIMTYGAREAFDHGRPDQFQIIWPDLRKTPEASIDND